MDLGKPKIPFYSLMHNGETVDFAIRSVEEVIEMFGTQADVPHRHNYYTVLWSQNNSGKHIIDYKEYGMHANEVFFVKPGQVHQVLHNADAKGIVILFTCDFMEKNYINNNFITNLGLFVDIEESPPIKVNKKSAERLQNLTTLMQEAILTDEEFRFDSIGAYLKLFLIECNKFAPSLDSDNTQTIQSAKSILRRFKELLDQNFIKMRKVNEYAEELSISPDYLNSVIKSGVGKTAKELIQQRIILESKRFGIHTQMSTKEIAYQLGFDDPSHFSRFFKNSEGISFAQFRESLEKELQSQ
jgi:AraC family transcriptional regulator, transcriptional activator of pobA